MGSKGITWETNGNFNAGVDFEFLKARVTGSFEYFYRMTSDMLFWFTVPASLGYSGYYDNIGDMRNAGVEIALNGNIFNNRNFRWDVYANATHYTNKVIMLPDTHKNREIDGYQGYASGNKFVAEGLPLNTFLMPKYAGVNKTTGEAMWYKDTLDEEGNVTGRETTTVYDDATDYLYTNSELFLHGSCNLLALALHDEFGYEVYEIRDNEDRMFHVFCKATYHGQDGYIDVRGITTDFAECLSDFSNRMYRGYYITRRDLGEDRALDGEGDITGYRFAKDIVEKYRSYYDVSF